MGVFSNFFNFAYLNELMRYKVRFYFDNLIKNLSITCVKISFARCSPSIIAVGALSNSNCTHATTFLSIFLLFFLRGLDDNDH